MHPGDLAGGYSVLEMTWLLYCAGAVTDILLCVIISGFIVAVQFLCINVIL